MKRFNYDHLPGYRNAWLSVLSIRFGSRLLSIFWGCRFRRVTETEYSREAYPFINFTSGHVGPGWET